VATTVVFGTEPWVSFSDEGVASVFGGCNLGVGTYQATANRLTFGGMSYEERECVSVLPEFDVMEM
jgi:heat shock protein HslJ